MRRNPGFPLLVPLLSLATVPAIARSATHPAAAKPQVGILHGLSRGRAGDAPLPPVSVQVTPGRIVSSTQQQLSIQVAPTLRPERISVRLKTAGTLSVASGPMHWDSPALPGHPATTAVTLQKKRHGEGSLLIIAVITLTDHTRMSYAALYTVEAQRHLPQEGHPGARQVTTPEGKRLLEVPAGP